MLPQRIREDVAGMRLTYIFLFCVILHIFARDNHIAQLMRDPLVIFITKTFVVIPYSLFEYNLNFLIQNSFSMTLAYQGHRRWPRKPADRRVTLEVFPAFSQRFGCIGNSRTLIIQGHKPLYPT